MKTQRHYHHKSLLAVLVLTQALVLSRADTVLTTFDYFTDNARYGSWATASIISTPSNYVVTATGYGSNWRYLGGINGTGNTNIQLDVSLSGPPAANNQLGPIISLVDNDGTYVTYAWYGQPLGNNLVLTGNLFSAAGSPGFSISTQAVGTVQGLDLSNIQHLHMAMDPGELGTSGAYTVAWNDLRLTDGSTAGPTGVCAVVKSFDNQQLAGTYGSWTSQTATPSSLQVTATGWGGGYAPVTPGVSTTGTKTLQLDVTLTAPAGAEGKLGPLVVLEDGDGTQLRYAWYGESPGANKVLTSVLSAGVVAQAGTVPGFDFSSIVYVHLQLDPSSYTGAYTVSWNDLSIIGCEDTTTGTGVCATISSFEWFWMTGNYGSWQNANAVTTETEWSMTASGFGGGYNAVDPVVATTPDRTLRMKLTLEATAAAAGRLGPIVVLEDGDGSQLRYAWYGQSPGTNLVLHSPLSAGVVAQAGTIPGFDFGSIPFFHLQLDPSSYTEAYTITMDDLAIIGCPEFKMGITEATYDRVTQLFTLTWTSEPGATYAIEATSNLAAGFSGELAAGIPSGGATTTVTVTATDPVASFVRIRKE